MKSDSLIIIAAAAAGLLLIYKVTSKATPASGQAVASAPAATYGNAGPTIGGSSSSPLGNVFDLAGVTGLSSGAAQTFGSDPYGMFGPSTIGNPANGTSSLMQAGGIMGAI